MMKVLHIKTAHPEENRWMKMNLIKSKGDLKKYTRNSIRKSW